MPAVPTRNAQQSSANVLMTEQSRRRRPRTAPGGSLMSFQTEHADFITNRLAAARMPNEGSILARWWKALSHVAWARTLRLEAA